MLLSISTTYQPATDLGFLLHKHPDRCQAFDLNFGKAFVYYPEANEERCEVCLLLDIDPIRLVRGKGNWQSGPLDQYVNDRPYVASSLMSVAISQVFGSALAGNSRDRPKLAATALPLTARLDVLPVRGGEDWLHRLFEPLGYSVRSTAIPLDPDRPDWGNGPHHSVELTATIQLTQLLRHLYVLVPVFDGKKHYFIGEAEVEKLLHKGATWLGEHPEKNLIARRYLTKRPSLVRQAMARLIEDKPPENPSSSLQPESRPADTHLGLHELRLNAVVESLQDSGARSVVDLGCGEGRLLSKLLAESQFQRILGLDVSVRSLEIAHRRLKLDRRPEHERARIELLHGALTYRDARIENVDAAALVEVIEHLDPPRISALERVVFESIAAPFVVVTTPNREYNVKWESLPAGELRHGDHRFEWSRSEFERWGHDVSRRFGYRVEFNPLGPEAPDIGAPSQMATFRRLNPA